MWKLITFFCFILFSIGCRKNNQNQITAKEFEGKLIQASNKLNHLIENKRLKHGWTGETMTTSEGVGYMTESEAMQIVEPLIDPSVSFLQSYYDINAYQYFTTGAPEIARLGALALRFKQLEDEGKAVDTSQINSWFSQTPEFVSQANGELLTNATQPSVIDCAMDALGVPAGLLIGSAKSLSKAALIKAAKKLALRTVGWIGVGIAIYEFGDCMNWW